ncbi:HPr family phosphocarrier protein [Lacrimispora sp. NSJ-141]|uniref:HPr family phosphocarrier protein n=1 Tax=Lientehia hominis TaxID=2897778 RepID=A0AAP2RJ39_9FIRM|nr:HPr family phosphocarrier protein [Lientehia hominis]MCD2492781.1 HPr family phosphocarrier protein [Lientehia hominis]
MRQVRSDSGKNSGCFLERIIEMRKINVTFDNVDMVEEFVHVVQDYQTDVDLKSGHCMVDAKSIVGVISMGLQKKMDLIIHTETCEELVERLGFCRVS